MTCKCWSPRLHHQSSRWSHVASTHNSVDWMICKPFWASITELIRVAVRKEIVDDNSAQPAISMCRAKAFTIQVLRSQVGDHPDRNTGELIKKELPLTASLTDVGPRYQSPNNYFICSGDMKNIVRISGCIICSTASIKNEQWRIEMRIFGRIIFMSFYAKPENTC